ncbi:putative sulfoacetate transporter SauU [Planctomycetes bacterium Pan216]|uniref:Putative sulfoacetate transporter SauU n=1 Tax=Kolteria novifilia TaxID=2527975 RepID=A0A518AZU5_9BACT|nr:putative sulfoacetate transporter SauU [Planctomycetes bacterium Pan216]
MNATPTHIRYRVLGWLTLAAGLAYVCRNGVGVAESTIREDLGLSLEQSGWFMGAFFWTYALFQVPGGWYAQRYGTRLSLTLFALAWSVATLFLGAASWFWLLVAAQLLMGLAQAGAFPASCNSIGHWMSFSERSLACGVLVAGMQIGAILASLLAGPLIGLFDWRWTFVLFALPGLVWAPWFFIRFRDDPQQSPEISAAELAMIRSERPIVESGPAEDESELATWLGFVRNPMIWLLCGQQIFRSAGYMFFASWFPTFLQKTRGVSVSESGFMQGLVLGGTLVGSLFGGLLIDWIWVRTGNLRLSRSGAGAFFLGGCGVLVFGAWFVETVTIAIALLTLGAFLAAIAGPCAFATSIDIGGSRVPQIFGLMNMCGNFAAAATPILVGAIFDRTSQWGLILLLFAGIYLAGALCWVFVDPKHRVAGA